MIVLVFIKFYTNSIFFRLVGSNRSLIILIMEFIHIFHYGTIFNKMIFSNINLWNKPLLIVILLYFQVKIGKAFCFNIVSSKDLLKLNYCESSLCHQGFMLLIPHTSIQCEKLNPLMRKKRKNVSKAAQSLFKIKKYIFLKYISCF